jgi:hypothetical protein
MAIEAVSYNLNRDNAYTLGKEVMATSHEFDTNKIVTICRGNLSYENMGIIVRISQLNEDETNIDVSYIIEAGSLHGVQPNYIRSMVIDSTRFLVVYGDSNIANYTYMVIVTITGDVATFGTPVQIPGTDVVEFYGSQVLESDKLIVSYRVSLTEKEYAIVLTLSGDSIILGSEFEYHSNTRDTGYTNYTNRICKISSTQVLVVYHNKTSLFVEMKILNISGSVITDDYSPVEFAPGGIIYGLSSITAYTNKILITYEYYHKLRFVFANVDGNSVTISSIKEMVYDGHENILFNIGGIIYCTSSGHVYKINVTNNDPVVDDLYSGGAQSLLKIGNNLISLSDQNSFSFLLPGSSTFKSAIDIAFKTEQGEQIEISSIYVYQNFGYNNSWLYFNGLEENDKLMFDNDVNPPIFMPNSPIVIKNGEKLYVSGKNIKMFGLKRSI